MERDAEQNAVWLDQLIQEGRSPAVIARVRVALEPDEQDGRPTGQATNDWEEDVQVIPGGRRCAVEIQASSGWWVGFSPRNGRHASVEGPPEDWEAMAKRILTYVGEQREREGGNG